MKLFASPTSPFVRKVRIAIGLKGLTDAVEVVRVNFDNPDDPIHAVNPLRKVPALLLDDGTSIYDSCVIAEYVDSIGTEGPRLFPTGPARWRARTLEALADGIGDAAVLCSYEKRYRPEEMWHQPWIDKQQRRVDTGLDVLEAEPPSDVEIAIGEVAVAATLSYLDLRFDGAWRKGRPRLAGWQDGFAARVPAYAATAPE